MVRSLRLLIRFLVLGAASAAVAYGLLAWQHQGFTLAGVWLVDNGWRLHPVHFVVIGIGLLPPTMWDIFALDVRARRGPAPDAAAAGQHRSGPPDSG